MAFSSKVIFISELVGTFGLLVAATGSIVFDARVGFGLGPIFIAAMHFFGLSILVFVFGQYSMAHFNPAVTLGLWLTGYTPTKKIPLYISAQAIGAILGSFFVKYFIGNFADLGLNQPDFSLNLGYIFSIEILATVFLMGVILIVVHLKFPRIFASLCIGAIVSLDVFFLGPLSGASMNPIRSFSPALVTGIFEFLWLYWTAPFIGSAIVSLIYLKKKKQG